MGECSEPALVVFVVDGLCRMYAPVIGSGCAVRWSVSASDTGGRARSGGRITRRKSARSGYGRRSTRGAFQNRPRSDLYGMQCETQLEWKLQ